MSDKIISIHKPVGASSTSILNKIKHDFRKKTGKKLKIGHGGTLDPLASGVLIVACESGTKELGNFLGCQKKYETIIKLGFTSSTDDEEGEKTFISSYKPKDEKVIEVVKSFIGVIDQTPPIYSAIHVNGKRAYELARSNVEVKMKSRKVTIFDITILSYSYPYLKIETVVSGGTYIRSLGKDIGEKLKVGGYLTELIRTAVNTYKLEDSLSVPDALNKIIEKCG
jgi:tRNA pseudouridine55 synthase